jgi:Arc/MetJ-type ribon-helix-helix transcriptional regulator
MTMARKELKSMHVSARVTSKFYSQIQSYMAQHGFDNLSEFVRYAIRKVLEKESNEAGSFD